VTDSTADDGTRKARLCFAAWFVAIAGVAFAVYTFPYADDGPGARWFTAYLSLYARLAGSVLSIFEPAVSVHGQEIVGRYGLRIVKTCDAMEVNILYAAAVLAFPGSFRRKLAGLAVGIPLLVMLNVARICTLYYVGTLAPGSFEFFHLELWPLVLFVAGAAGFLAWATWAARTDLQGTAPRVAA
jgi:exosortase/archaeosortase family protein